MHTNSDTQIVRVLLAGADSQGRMQLRRILAGNSNLEIVGHIRPGAAIEEMLDRARADVVLIDAAENAEAAKDALLAALRYALRVVVLAVDGGFAAYVGVARSSILHRPADLASENAQSSFGVSLHKKLSNSTSGTVLRGKASPVIVASARRSAPWVKPDIIAIGCSTGGPQALPEVLSGIAGRVTQPVVITQHMPAAFTRMLATHLSRYTVQPAVEAMEGMPVVPGCVYIAPGGRHFLVARKGDQIVCQLDDGPQENFCRPAVDPMLRSVIAAVGGKALAVILTGMGQDGLAGCRSLIDAGGAVLAQDEATSIVWGMPGAVAQAGLCRAVLPLNRIAGEIIAAAGGIS